MKEVATENGSVKNTLQRLASASVTQTARLIAVLHAAGITDRREIEQLTGRNERQVRRALSELQAVIHDRSSVTAPVIRDRSSVTGKRSSSPLKKKGLPHTPSKEKIHPSPPAQPEKSRLPSAVETRGEERAHKVSQRSARKIEHSVPTSKKPAGPVFRGAALIVDAALHERWSAMFPGMPLPAWYAIADAECAERGKVNGAAVTHAQRKLGYLHSDVLQEDAKLSPQERKEREIERRFAAEPGYMGRGG